MKIKTSRIKEIATHNSLITAILTVAIIFTAVLLVYEIASPLKLHSQYAKNLLKDMEAILAAANTENNIQYGTDLTHEEISAILETRLIAIKDNAVPVRVYISEYDPQSAEKPYFFISTPHADNDNSEYLIHKKIFSHVLGKETGFTSSKIIKSQMSDYVLATYQLIKPGKVSYVLVAKIPVGDIFLPGDFFKMIFLLSLIIIFSIAILYRYKRISSEIKTDHDILLGALDNLGLGVAVIDISNKKTLYSNKIYSEMFNGKYREGDYCYRNYGFNEKCPWCQEYEGYESDLEKSGSIKWEFYDTVHERWFERNDSQIIWLDKTRARIAVFTDITERKKTISISNFRSSQQQFFSDVSLAMLSLEGYDDKISYLLEKTCQFFFSAHVTLIKASLTERIWSVEQTFTNTKVAEPISLDAAVKFDYVHKELLEKPFIISENLSYYREFCKNDDPNHYDNRAACILGITANGKLYGALYFDFDKDYQSRSNDFWEFLYTLQAIIVFTVQNKLIAEDLEWGNRRMDSIFNGANALILYTDAAGRILNTNGQFLVGTGEIGKVIFDVLENEKISELKTGYETVLINKTSYQFTAEGSSGNIYLIDLYPLFDSKNDVFEISAFIVDVTKEHKKEEEFLLIQKALKAMLGSMPVSIWILDANFEIILFDGNVTIKNLIDVNGRPDGDILKQRIYKAALGWSSSFTYNYNSAYINNYISPFTDEAGEISGVIGVSIDITDIKSMQIKVSSLNDRLNIAIDASRAGIWEIIPSLNKLICNDNTYKLLGLNPANTLIDVPEFLDKMLEKRTIEQLSGLASEENTLIETKLIWSDGSIHYVTNYIRSSLDTDTGAAKIYGISIDNTAQSMMSLQLIEARDRAEIANQAKSQFLSKMSHEIRTPMNAIIGMTSLAKRTDNLERIQDYLDKIEISNEHLLNIINDILDMSKIESGKLQLFEQEFDLENIIKNAVNIVLVKINEKKQRLTVEFDPSLTFKFYGDDVRLSQVIINLLSNANKFTPINGSISISVNLDYLEGREAVVGFRVTDTGIGIDKNKTETIFKPFEQADGSVTRKFGGTGLGLSICKKIIELMGGRITVESELERGSTFSFTVRLKVLSNELAPAISVNIEPKQLRILAVDDSIEVLDYISEVLKTHNLPCDTSPSGEDAITAVKRSIKEKRPYNIVYMDYKMPGISGFEAAKEIYRLTDSKCLIIMISSYNMDDIKEDARANGILKFLEKPLFPSSIVQVITDLTGSAGNIQEDVNETVSPYNFNGKSILLAEDVEINAEIVKELLLPTGISVDIAYDGTEAVKLYTENPNKYDLIFMDVQMPVMDGYEATSKIRKSGLKTSKDIPIIAMTANVFREDYDKEIFYGMNGHINKPIDETQMLDTLKAYLSADKPDNLSQKEGTQMDDSNNAPAGDFYGMDINEALSRVNNNLKLYKRLLKTFVDSDYYEKLIQALAENDDKNAVLAAHSIKGVASNLSLKILWEAATALERLLKLGEFKQDSHEFDHFKECYELTVKSINNYLS